MGELAIEAIYPLGYIHLLTNGAAIRRVFALATAHFHQLYVDNRVEDLASVSLEMDGDIIGSIVVGRIGCGQPSQRRQNHSTSGRPGRRVGD
jgi:hypothetical protein